MNEMIIYLARAQIGNDEIWYTTEKQLSEQDSTYCLVDRIEILTNDNLYVLIDKKKNVENIINNCSYIIWRKPKNEQTHRT